MRKMYTDLMNTHRGEDFIPRCDHDAVVLVVEATDNFKDGGHSISRDFEDSRLRARPLNHRWNDVSFPDNAFLKAFRQTLVRAVRGLDYCWNRGQAAGLDLDLVLDRCQY